MKLVIGLGNPGPKYLNNRHNVGCLVVDKIKKLTAKKTNVFMNESGKSVKSLLSKYSNTSLQDLYIVHDDLDIKLGEYKIQFGRGPKDHNGIKDIEAKLGTSDFWRVRVGVDNREPNNRIPGEDYVLEDFTEEERKIVDSVIDEICKKLEMS
ncbi:MAG: aminoacyl-tRNA hydrolase [Patescibacteria group bacterium]